MICLERWNGGIMECWKDGTFEQTCLRKPHEQVVGRIVGANNNGRLACSNKYCLAIHFIISSLRQFF
jgi:hypothetical protein